MGNLWDNLWIIWDDIYIYIYIVPSVHHCIVSNGEEKDHELKRQSEDLSEDRINPGEWPGVQPGK